MKFLLNYLPAGLVLRKSIVRMRRFFNCETFCTSRLYDGRTDEYICDALEDTVRDLNHNGVFDGEERKIPEVTAIPCGRYYVTFRNTGLSIKKEARRGMIPYINDVPHFTHIRIHPGRTAEDSKGCILLGKLNEINQLEQSEATCLKFYDRMKYLPFILEITDEWQ